ncbi:MAG TPA: hypothetical protein VN886_09160 [Acidimicrobiales bacterium]|nr:hypothetical protein [Acidimicrobiales bacterium]
MPPGEHVGIDFEAAQILAGEVDATSSSVLEDVLPVLGQLETGADGVGTDNLIRPLDPEDAENQATHGVRREAAIGEEMLERLVGGDLLVSSVGLNEIEQGLRVDPEFTNRRGGLYDQGVTALRLRPGVLQLVQREPGFTLEPVQSLQAVAAVVVADVVDQACEAIEREEMPPRLPREDRRRNGEVLPGGAAQNLRGRGQPDRSADGGGVGE